MDINDLILRFFRDDIGGILITDSNGEIIYDDEKAARIRRESKSWKVACPPMRQDQKAEVWELHSSDSGITYMVLTSTFSEKGTMLQIHSFLDINHYTELLRDMNHYSGMLQDEKDRDGMTGLYNKGKFLQLKASLFRTLDSIAVMNLDINFLKETNDNLGHAAGDRLILKAAESLHRIESRNIMAFRVGGDEFIVVALHVSREEAEKIRSSWEEALAQLNRQGNDVPCIAACGLACGGEGYDLDEVLARADQLMYEDKKTKRVRTSE